MVLLYQVNSVMDVSRPLYQQLQTLTDADNSNVDVSATQATQSNRVCRLSVVIAIHVVHVHCVLDFMILFLAFSLLVFGSH